VSVSRSWSRWVIYASTIAVAVAAGCRLPPPKPVLVYVPTSVIVDPDAPNGRSRVASVAKSFWQAMSLLDTAYAAKHPVTDEQRAFSHALGMVLTGRHDEAELALDSIGASASDSLLRVTSRVLMTAMLQYQDKWKILADLAGTGSKPDSIFLGDVNKADVESWATAFKNVKPRQITFSTKTVTLPLLLSASGTPMVVVSVNGKPKTMWLDTGSSMSIVSSDVAVECGIKPLVPDTLEVATTTGHVPARPAAIDRIDIGGHQILNSTAMIVSTDLMQVRVGDENNPVLSVNIDGVIGYDIISRMDIRIDYVHKLVTFLKPEPVRGQVAELGRNLFWVGTPIVRLVSDRGVPLHFNLDTGAQETYSTEGLVGKTRARTFAGERRLIGGLAGLLIVHGTFIDEMRLSMGGQRLLFRNVLVYAPALATFVPLDGVIGSDVGRSGTVRIDATNGLFLLEDQQSDQGLKIKS
jgi:hypothetical protein